MKRLLFQLMVLVQATMSCAGATAFLSPTELSATLDGQTLFIGCATANEILCLGTVGGRVENTIAMPAPPTGMIISADGRRLLVTAGGAQSWVCLVNLAHHEIERMIPVGHSSLAPVLNGDGRTLYVCDRFNDAVGVVDLADGKEVLRISVQREPVAATITKDNKFLLVCNQLHAGRADTNYVAAVVSVIDLAQNKVVKELALPNGSGSLKGIRISSDGKYAAVTHLIGRFDRITTRVDRGWMHVNAVTIIDIARMEIRNTALLDDADAGAANPWGVDWSADGSKLLVAHAGVNEVSVSDFPMLLEQLPEQSETYDAKMAGSHPQAEHANYLPFLLGSRQRVKLPATDLGPRALLVVGHTAYTANYFSDTLSVIDLDSPQPNAKSIPLGPKTEMDTIRKGEYYFHDANLCQQGWQSCSSCHPGDARVDGLNWDLLNDGIDNPKNTKSLLWAHKTPPAMFLGVRKNAEAAVRAGIVHILFTNQPESVAVALDEYLKSLKPVPSPHLVHGQLSESAKKGEKLFNGSADCANCHVPGLYTDLKAHNVGTNRKFDKPTDKFYTPTLVEVWRTAPYLHDGSAATVRDVLTTRNQDAKHGDVEGLTSQQIDDLCEYVLSL